MDRDLDSWRGLPAPAPAPAPAPGSGHVTPNAPTGYSWFEQSSGAAAAEPEFDELTVPLRIVRRTESGELSYSEPDVKAYEIPEVPEAGWSAAPSARRFWISRALVFVVLLIQAALSLRLRNTAQTDEASVLVIGRDQLNHLLHGTPLTSDLVHQFSGAPWLYPMLASVGESLYGVAGARLLSLAFALAGTAVLYSLTRRLFNERVAICAAGSHAVLQSTVVLGFYASADALAILLIAIAAWIIVRTNRSPVATVLLATPAATLAVGTEYAALLVLPSLFLLAVVTARPHHGISGALLRGLLLAAGTLGLLILLGDLTHTMTGLSTSTLARHPGTEAGTAVLAAAMRWGGLFFVIAGAGGAAYIWRERMYELPDGEHPLSSRPQRVLLVLLLCGTALLVPAYQAHLHSSAAMYRHIGLGLLFAAPLAGLGITRLVGAHFRQPQLGILVWVLMLAMGLSQSTQRFQTWPNASPLLGAIYPHVDSKSHYLTELDGIPAYYLRGVTSVGQWTSAEVGIDFQDSKGVWRHGAEGSQLAAQSGWFKLIVLDSSAPRAEENALASAISSGGHYRLIAQIPYRGTSGVQQTYRVYLAS